MNEQPITAIKASVTAVLQSLPDDVSWDEIHYRLYVREQIEAGLSDSAAGRLLDSDELTRRLENHKRNNRQS